MTWAATVPNGSLFSVAATPCLGTPSDLRVFASSWFAFGFREFVPSVTTVLKLRIERVELGVRWRVRCVPFANASTDFSAARRRAMGTRLHPLHGERTWAGGTDRPCPVPPIAALSDRCALAVMRGSTDRPKLRSVARMEWSISAQQRFISDQRCSVAGQRCCKSDQRCSIAGRPAWKAERNTAIKRYHKNLRKRESRALQVFVTQLGRA